jgi:HCOMODA/2-hydroxy-3-carboxy-muconic semialdehyde decarboxylase
MIARRTFCCCAAAALSSGLVHAQARPSSAGPADPALIEDLVTANRILVDQGVVDGFGHVSARHDRDPNRFLLSRSSCGARRP